MGVLGVLTECPVHQHVLVHVVSLRIRFPLVHVVSLSVGFPLVHVVSLSVRFPLVHVVSLSVRFPLVPVVSLSVRFPLVHVVSCACCVLGVALQCCCSKMASTCLTEDRSPCARHPRARGVLYCLQSESCHVGLGTEVRP